MDFTISDELKMLRDLARQFVEKELIPLESVYVHPELPEEPRLALEKKAIALGLWAAAAPATFGGGGVNNLGMAIIHEEMGKTCLRFELGNPANWAILALGTPQQIERYLIPTIKGERHSMIALTEPNAGSDAAAIEATAVRNGGHFVLNGTKVFSSRWERADFMLTFAKTAPEKGRNGVTCFIVDNNTPGVRHVRWITVLGGRRTSELRFEDCRLPMSAVLGEVDKGFDLMQKRVGNSRFVLSSTAIGTSVRCLKMAAAYAKHRHTFGQPLASRQAVQWMLADSAIDIRAARLLVHDAAWRADNGTGTRTDASICKVFATEMVGRVVDRAIQIHGGIGVTQDLPLERFYSQVRTLRIVEGPSEIHRATVAKAILRGESLV